MVLRILVGRYDFNPVVRISSFNHELCLFKSQFHEVIRVPGISVEVTLLQRMQECKLLLRLRSLSP